jgi:triosephosphate isomerase
MRGGGRRRPVVGVSLKMYFDPERTVRWSAAVADIAAQHQATAAGLVDLFVLPSLPALNAVVEIFAGTTVSVGAQDLFWEDRGPYTGGISGADLRSLGCSLVEVGHVDRRRVFGEDDLVVRAKLTAAFRNGLEPVLCVGERQQGPPDAAASACVAQLERALDGADPGDGAALIVAYEPEWAIGVGMSADPDHVVTVIGHLRAWLDNGPLAAPARIIYGGSAGPGLLPMLDGSVDGLFLGRLVHDPLALRPILDEALAAR